MSERQAKKRRMEVGKDETKKSKSGILINCVLTLLVVAVAGVGGWAVYTNYGDNATDVQTEQVQQTQTIEQYAQSVGMTADDFLNEYGLVENEEVTKDMDVTLATEYMTIENYAKFSGLQVDGLKEALGLGEEFTNDMLMSEVYAKMMEGSMNTQDDSQN